MDEESIESNLATYKQQLSQIETVLQSAGTEGQEDLVQLRKDLTELVELTEASLLSVKKSKLLGFVDNLEASASGSALSQTSMNEISGQQCQDDDEEDDEDVDDDDEDEDDDDEAAVNAIIGTTCSVQYMPGWGPTQYCNAVILSVESLGETENDKGQVRVLFCNPTSNSMLPCPHFLDGECRFDDKCRFSHGYIVNVEDIQPFRDPDYSLLTPGRRCLALQDDGLWHRAKIESADNEAHLYCVKILNDTVTVPVDVLFPIEATDESSDEENPANEHVDDDDDLHMGDLEWKATGATRSLGDWEAHTKGIGSKLMAKMGYKLGDGLGKTNQGRREPVEAVVLPPGKSLDIIAELKKKNKLGIFNKMKKKKNVKRLGGHVSQRKSRNVFDFLNKKLGGSGGDERMKITKDRNRHEVKFRNKKNLNIQLVQIHQQMRELEREMSKLKEARIRNVGTDKTMTAQIDDKMAAAQQMMTSLKQQAKKIERQQHSMKEHKKLTIF